MLGEALAVFLCHGNFYWIWIARTNFRKRRKEAPADLLGEVCMKYASRKDREVSVAAEPLYLLSARDRARPERKLARRSLLDEETRKDLVVSNMTVVPVIPASTAANQQKIVFHSLKYGGVFYQ